MLIYIDNDLKILRTLFSVSNGVSCFGLLQFLSQTLKWSLICCCCLVWSRNCNEQWSLCCSTGLKTGVKYRVIITCYNGRLPSKNSPKVFDFHPEFWHIDRQPKLDEGQQTKQQQQQSLLSFSQWGSDNFFLAGGLPIQVLADQFIKIYYKQCKS